MFDLGVHMEAGVCFCTHPVNMLHSDCKLDLECSSTYFLRNQFNLGLGFFSYILQKFNFYLYKLIISNYIAGGTFTNN